MSEQNKNLTVSQPQTYIGDPLAITDQQLNFLYKQSSMYLKSGFLPQSIKTIEAAAVIILKGRELQIPPMQAFSHIHVINGKPGLSAELMVNLVYRNCPGAVINYLESTESKCTVEAIRPGHKPFNLSFTIDEARKADLMRKDVWKNYPAAMLRARAVSALCRAVFPDCLGGMSYTPEELGGNVDKDGNVIHTTATHVTEPEKQNDSAKSKEPPAVVLPNPKVEEFNKILKRLETDLQLTPEMSKNYIKQCTNKSNLKEMTADDFKLLNDKIDEHKKELSSTPEPVAATPAEPGTFEAFDPK